MYLLICSPNAANPASVSIFEASDSCSVSDLDGTASGGCGDATRGATWAVGSPCEAGGLLAVVTLAQCVLYTEYSCTNRIRALAPSSGHS